MTEKSNAGMSDRDVKELIKRHLSGAYEEPDQDTTSPTNHPAMAPNGPGIEGSLRAALGIHQ